ncbi:MAG: ribosome biogenesis GTP-binding protein YihA/YsxC [Clostridia bacterium]|jgi:GTP-binding protein|nr:ribosome biogenesis GTP-binding protein YihA/YsxC [Clostridia bacterium]
MNSIKAEIYKIIMEDIEPLLIDKPQIALVGRSNVGKSSLINYLCGCNTLARTSKDPGKTKTINYYSCNEGAFFIVDLPGYGYAKVSKETRNKWSFLINRFFLTAKKSLALFILDARRDVASSDTAMMEYFYKNRIPFSVIISKCDLIQKNTLSTKKQIIANQLKIGADNIIMVSAKYKIGKAEILARIGKQLDALQNIN